MHSLTLREGSRSFKIVITDSEIFKVPLDDPRSKLRLANEFAGAVDLGIVVEKSKGVIVVTPELLRFRIAYPEAYERFAAQFKVWNQEIKIQTAMIAMFALPTEQQIEEVRERLLYDDKHEHVVFRSYLAMVEVLKEWEHQARQ